MHKEITSLHTKGTWELVELPEERKHVKCKWMFCVKVKADGTFDKFKARLVAKGFSQVPGIDFHETFFPVIFNYHRMIATRPMQ